jgi:hypothetical protein
MAADGLHDDDGAADALDYLSEHIGRAGSRFDRPDPGPLDREQSYNELRARDSGSDSGAVRGSAADAADHTADGGWAWKGLELDPPANRIADDALAARRAAEGRDGEGNYAETGITPAMRQVEAELEHGTLVPDTERFALKSPDRFKEKLAKLITRYPDQPVDGLASAIHDGIRYTLLFPGEHYAAGAAEATRLLSDRGYQLELRKPSWDDASYRGMNCRWSDGTVQFEVQFHTPESWEAKQKTHDIYEKLCDSRTTPQECGRLEHQQREIVAAVPVPPGALEIEFYRRGDRG